ncbi:hypothetical protein TYRP_023629 [Tyrophagus putrescentiae]|nr:hypothetical protein TYRP_023629 [Tyrophagus putrescentiae]
MMFIALKPAASEPSNWIKNEPLRRPENILLKKAIDANEILTAHPTSLGHIKHPLPWVLRTERAGPKAADV